MSGQWWIRILKSSREKPDTLHFSFWNRVYECAFLCNITAQRWNNKNSWHVFFDHPKNFCIPLCLQHMAFLLVYFSTCWCKHLTLPPSLIAHPPDSPDDKQLRQQLKGTKRPGRALSPHRPCLLDKGPPLLTSINPLYCVGGKGHWWGDLSNLILCDLGDVQRQQ